MIHLKNISPIYGLVGCAFFWGLNAIVAREFRYISDPFDLNFFRWLFAFLIISPFAYKQVIEDFPIIKKNFFKLFILATLSISLFNSFQYLGGETTSSINLGLINSMSPIFMMALSWPILGQRPTIWMIFGIVLSFCGVSLVILQEGLFRLDWFHLVIGDFWMLIAVIIWGFYGVLYRLWSIKMQLLSLLWTTIFFGVLITPIASAIYHFRLPTFPQFHFELIGLYPFIAIFPGILAYLFWNRGVSAYGPTISAIFIYLSPCFIALISYLFLDAELTYYHLFGGVLIFLGFCSVFLKKSKPN